MYKYLFYLYSRKIKQELANLIVYSTNNILTIIKKYYEFLDYTRIHEIF